MKVLRKKALNEPYVLVTKTMYNLRPLHEPSKNHIKMR